MPAMGSQSLTGGMPNYYQSGPTGRGRRWYENWLKAFGGRGRYGGGKAAFDLALDFAKGGGASSEITANATNPIMTAAYNAGKDYMRATGQRESSSGGNAQAGLLATLAAGKAGGIASNARNTWMDQLTGLGDLEAKRLGIEIGEEGGYGDYFLQRGNSRTDAWLRNKQLNQNVQSGVTAGASYMSNASPFKDSMQSSQAPMDQVNDYGRGRQPDWTGGSMNAPPTAGSSNVTNNAGGGAPSGGGTTSRPVQNSSTEGIDPFAAFKATLKQQRSVYPPSLMGRVR